MIKSLRLPVRAPFDAEQTTIDGLNRVNYLFGPNGSGKTTISQFIAENADSTGATGVEWENGMPIRTYVYNRAFVTRNFANSDSVPGVFTMGEDSIEAQNAIVELKSNIEKETAKRDSAKTQLEQANDDLAKAQNAVRDACWQVKVEMPDLLTSHLKGRSSKQSFQESLFAKITFLVGGETLPDLGDLEQRASVIFDDSETTATPIPAVDFSSLASCGEGPVLQKVIVGKEDLPIGALIKKLGNSDWVAQGREYVSDDDVCPFCQRHTLTDELKAELEDFFDETYQTDIGDLNKLSRDYASYADEVIEAIEGIVRSYERFIDAQTLQARLAELKGIVQANKGAIARKQAQPSIAVTLTSIDDVRKSIDELLASGRNAVQAHNDMIRNRTEEKASIVEEIWQYAALTAISRIKPLQDVESAAQKKVNGLKATIAKQDEAIEAHATELRALESAITNVKETAEAINKLLAKFGFENFKVDVADDEKSYCIVRGDGTPVKDTLSEGESSFLTFLYFYHLMNGSQEETGTTDSRVVVIDDPISSMDADVLFVVSTLTRQLAKEARDGNGKTVQLIVLTHNITFHREITYIRNREGNPNTSYYVIRKDGSHSSLHLCEKNPICSTYELLWEDLFRSDCRPLTAANVARRITETFFKLVGGVDPDTVIASMSSPDREIARSYMSWANAGSHSPFDDETYFNNETVTDVYRRVLGDLFRNAGYEKHYEEMVSRFTEKQEE